MAIHPPMLYLGLVATAVPFAFAIGALVTRQLEDGYEVVVHPPWEDYPTDDVEADVRRMNAFIEERVREMPEQYFWAHKRFKTRPPGEPSPYRRR